MPTPQPASSCFTPARLLPAPPGQRSGYVRCLRAPDDLLGVSEARVRSDARWKWQGLDAGHGTMLSAPQALADLLPGIA
ncbi:hypothetical protein [Xylophilus sp.]|uniref:hypothetical protein n=1 Tax=Xylophilus sp. TaxID=2653893 RepID=UPI0013B99ECE|nr:hypothetical protein [Xylophilus sp.]KAF1045451.1 MAG: hypothetical protein GAK38_03047 [Xylophilus sp.]